MKKVMIPVVSALLIAALFAGCRRNVATVTDNTTQSTTQSTTHAATQPTQTTRHTQPSQTAPMPSVTPDGTDTTDTGRSRMLPPRY